MTLYIHWPWTRIRVPRILGHYLEPRLRFSREVRGWTARVFWDNYPGGRAYICLAQVQR